MAIDDNTIYGLKGKQVKDVADKIKENASGIAGLETALSGKQDTLTTAQLAAVNSGVDSTKVGQIATNASNIDTIEGKIPAQATSSNQLADKDFVNSSIATNTANFIGTFNSVAELEAYSGPVTNNDYAFVVVTDAQGNTAYDRYKYNGSTSTWLFEYELNNSSFTADQWASINSGITSGDVTKLSGIAAGAEVNVQSNWNESDTSSDAYILNKPANLVQDASYVHTDNNFTTTLKDKLDGIEAGAEVNDINSISVNGTAVTPDANKNVALTIDEGIKTLTTADYNWPTNNPNCVGLWLLPDGVYDCSGSSVLVRAYTGEAVSGGLAYVSSQAGSSKIIRYLVSGVYYQREVSATGGNLTLRFVEHPEASLSSTSGAKPLAASQGNELVNRINSRVKTNAGAPTTSTTGTKGQLLEDTTNGNLYICTNSASPYAWKQIDKDEILTNAGAPTTSTAGTLGQLLTDTTNAKLYQLTAIDATDPQNPSYTWSEIGGGSSVNAFTTNEWNALWS